MPLFEYHCQECDHRFEVLAGPGTRPDCPGCPACGSYHTRGILGGFAVTGSARSAGGNSCGPCSGGTCSSCH